MIEDGAVDEKVADEVEGIEALGIHSDRNGSRAAEPAHRTHRTGGG